MLSSWYSVYFVYWYRSTNTDAEGTSVEGKVCVQLYLLYWYRSTNTDSKFEQHGFRKAKNIQEKKMPRETVLALLQTSVC